MPPEVQEIQEIEVQKPVLLDASFTTAAQKYGVSYALLQKEIEAKKAATGKALSASQYAKAERKIRTMVNAAEGQSITGIDLANICTALSQSNSLYFDYDHQGNAAINFLKEKDPHEWVRHARRGEVPQPTPPEATIEEIVKPEPKRRKFGFKFYH